MRPSSSGSRRRNFMRVVTARGRAGSGAGARFLAALGEFGGHGQRGLLVQSTGGDGNHAADEKQADDDAGAGAETGDGVGRIGQMGVVTKETGQDPEEAG